MVTVKGPPNSLIPGSPPAQLGLASERVMISIQGHYLDLKVDAAGGQHGPPTDVQTMLAEATISMNLIHFDQAVLRECIRLSTGGGSVEGKFPRAGTRLGNNTPQFTNGNNLISVNILSPVEGVPWRFPWCYMLQNPVQIPLGAERTIAQVTWRAIVFQQDPWEAGLGASATNVLLYDHGLDT